jgi:hypothetical protein
MKKLKKIYNEVLNFVFGYKHPGKVRQFRAELIDE